MQKFIGGFLAIILLFVFGCAELTPPTPKELITHPWGTKPSLRIGKTKDEVVASWGEPDEKINLGAVKYGLPKEEWVYYGRFPEVPLDYKYLSKTKHLIFEGKILTGFREVQEEVQGKAK